MQFRIKDAYQFLFHVRNTVETFRDINEATMREIVGEKYRSEGQGEASKILGEKERELKRIQSEAYKTAQKIIGKADAEATTIYAGAYNRNSESREFYRFLKTMETYKTTLSDKDWLFLSTKGDFFGYFQKQSGR